MEPPILVGGDDLLRRAGPTRKTIGRHWRRRFSSGETRHYLATVNPSASPKLQWSRRFSSAETRPHEPTRGLVVEASMEPPILVGGDSKQRSDGEVAGLLQWSRRFSSSETRS